MKVIFRVNCDKIIGFGHYFRCLTLAQILKKKNYEVILFTNKSDHSDFPANEVIKVSDQASYSEDDLNAILKLIKSRNINWTVIDGYQFSKHFCEKIYSSSSKLLIIDDLPRFKIQANAILNQNYKAESFNFQTDSQCLKYFGLNYLLIRESLKKSYSNLITHQSNKSNHILITLGGSQLATKEILKINSFLENLTLFHLCLSNY